jgi:hypothetical protein
MYNKDDSLVELQEVLTWDKAIEVIKQFILTIKTFEISNDKMKVKGSVSEDYKIHMGFPNNE